MSRFRSALLVGWGILLLASCNTEEPEPPHDLDEQRRIDIEIIDAYLAENGLELTDTTESGARYVIMEPGSGKEFVYDDFVIFDYIGGDIEGNIFTSSIPELQDSLLLFPEEPEYFTFTATGWTLRYLLVQANFIGTGFNDAVTAAFKDMQVGGHVKILLPSSEAFGSLGSYHPDGHEYAVLEYDIYIIDAQ